MKASDRIIALNTVLLCSTELLTKVVSLFLVILVARRLGPEIMGIYAFALTLVGLFDVFVNFGLDRFIQREIGRQPELTRSLFTRVFALKLSIFSLSAVVILILGLTIVDSDLKRWVVWLLSLSLFFRANIASNNAFFRAHQKAQYEAVVVMGFRLVYGTAGIAAIFSGCGLIALAGLELAAQVAACFLSWFLFARKISSPARGAASAEQPSAGEESARSSLWERVRGIVHWRELVELMKSARTFLLIRIVISFFASVNMLMLSMMAGDVVTGFYSAALRLSSSFDFLPEAFTGAFLPVLSRQITHGWDAFSDIFRNYFKYLLTIGLGLAAVLGGLAENFILLVFGQAFRPSIPTLSILGATLVMDFVTLAFSNALIAQDKEGRIVRIFIAAAVVNILLNLVLIPLYQQDGAAMATFLSVSLVLVLQFHALGWQRFRDLGLGGIAARPLLAGILTFVLGRLLVTREWNVMVGFLVMPLVFLALLILTGALSRSELAGAVSLLPFGRKSPDEA